MATNEENVNQESLDEAALNEEASRELAAMVAEAEQSSSPATDDEGEDDGPLAQWCTARVVPIPRRSRARGGPATEQRFHV